MSTYQTVADHIKFLTGQDNLSSADTLRVLNFALDSYSDLAMECDGRWKFDANTTTTNPIATTNLVADQNQYTLDTNFLQIDRIEALVDGSWTVLEQTDRREDRQTPLETRYSEPGVPKYYDYDGHAIFLYPTPSESVTAGLKVYHTRPVEYVTALSETIGIPRTHTEYLAVRAALQVTMRTNDPNRSQLQNEVTMWETKIKDYFTYRDEDRARRIKPRVDSTFNRTFNKNHS